MRAKAVKIFAPNFSSKSAAFYGRMVRSFPWGMCVIHLPNGARVSTWTLVAANTQAERLAGPSLAHYLKLALNDEAGVHRRHVDLPTAIRAAWDDKQASTLGYHTGRMKFHPASIFAVQAVPLEENCVALLFHDVTLSVLSKRGQVAAESRLHQICSSARALLWTADPATLQCHTVTPQARHVLGYWPERWQNEVNFLRNHSHPDDWERFRSSCAQAVLDETVAPFDLRMFDSSGDTHWFQMHLSLREIPGPRRELSGVMVDITDQKLNEHASRLLSARVMRAQEKERKRISRDLHDSVGQYLTGLHWGLKRLQREAGIPEALRDELAECSRTAQVCMEEVRAVSYALHPPAIDMLGLGPAIEWQAKRFAGLSGLRIHVEIPDGVPRLSPDAEITLFRVFQECLSNVRRHAKTDAAHVRLRSEGGRMHLEVEDRGVGIPAEVHEKPWTVGCGIGLLKMRERLEDLGGSLEILSNSSGTLVRARVPLAAAPAPEQPAPKPISASTPRSSRKTLARRTPRLRRRA